MLPETDETKCGKRAASFGPIIALEASPGSKRDSHCSESEVLEARCVLCVALPRVTRICCNGWCLRQSCQRSPHIQRHLLDVYEVLQSAHQTVRGMSKRENGRRANFACPEGQKYRESGMEVGQKTRVLLASLCTLSAKACSCGTHRKVPAPLKV